MRRTSEQWGELLRAQQLSGLSMAAFCREQGIREKSFYYWHRKRVAKIAEGGAFVRVMTPASRFSAPACTMRVGTAELAFSDAVSPTWLAQVLKALA